MTHRWTNSTAMMMAARAAARVSFIIPHHHHHPAMYSTSAAVLGRNVINNNFGGGGTYQRGMNARRKRHVVMTMTMTSQDAYGLATMPNNNQNNNNDTEITDMKHMLVEHSKALEKQQDMLVQIMYKLQQQSPSTTSSTTPTVPPLPPPTSKSPRGFLDFSRNAEPYRSPKERARDWKEIYTPNPDPVELKRQVSRCMDCGTPFCQTHTGCPINNLIPEWNELVLTDQWKEAIDRLHSTNNFPEFTGKVCPAPCEGACVAGVNDPKDAVTIKNSEYAIVDRAFKEGWIVPRLVTKRSGKKIAIVGSGPAGLAAADQLNQMGHQITVYEKDDRIGGLLMYGIPTMKLDKYKVDRRVDLLRKEGIEFKTDSPITSKQQLDGYDAIILAIGAGKPRDLSVPGRNLENIYFAMDFLTRNQKDLVLDATSGNLRNKWGDGVVSVTGKNVVVIGGGDTGTDCIGTSVRHFCKSLVNLEIQARPPEKRDDLKNPWPNWPRIYRTDYGHAEVAEITGQDPRRFSTMIKRFLPDATKTAVRAVQVVSLDGQGQPIANSEREILADVVILAMGFVGVEDWVGKGFGVDLTKAGNIKADFGKFDTNLPGVFAAGDCRRGQSLVVWGIREGRDVANRVNEYLSGGSG